MLWVASSCESTTNLHPYDRGNTISDTSYYTYHLDVSDGTQCDEDRSDILKEFEECVMGIANLTLNLAPPTKSHTKIVNLPQGSVAFAKLKVNGRRTIDLY